MNRFTFPFVIAVFLMFQNLAMAQLPGPTGSPSPTDLPTIVPPSPSVSSLMSFEEVPVSYYSGQPNISIPFYSKDLGFGITMPVSMSYSTTGVRINERSGWTGTGWNLEAGGVVSRTVRGIPDEEVTGGLNGIKTGVLHIPTFWDYYEAGTTIAEKQKFLWEANGSSADQYDFELDQFQFSFLGISGSFVIVR